MPSLPGDKQLWLGTASHRGVPPRGLRPGGTGARTGASRVGKAESRGVRGGDLRGGELRAGGEVRGGEVRAVRDARRLSSSSRARACGWSTRKRRPVSSSPGVRPGKAGSGAAAAATGATGTAALPIGRFVPHPLVLGSLLGSAAVTNAAGQFLGTPQSPPAQHAMHVLLGVGCLLGVAAAVVRGEREMIAGLRSLRQGGEGSHDA